MTPEVSIILTAYNFEDFIGQAIESCLKQKTNRTFEIIVVDDGSSDKTAQACQAFGDQVRFYRNEKNQGAAFSRNRGLKEAKGRYLLQMDGDDVIFPDTLESYARVLDRDQSVGFVYGHPEFWDEQKMNSYRVKCQPFELKRLLSGEGIVICSAYMFRKEVFDRIGYYDESLKAADDHDMFLRVGESFKAEIVPEFVMARRMKGWGLLASSRESGLMTEEKKKVKLKSLIRRVKKKFGLK